MLTQAHSSQGRPELMLPALTCLSDLEISNHDIEMIVWLSDATGMGYASSEGIFPGFFVHESPRNEVAKELFVFSRGLYSTGDHQ